VELRCAIELRSVSIIVPTFNGASRIGRCIEALVDQAERHDAEILIVNDGSTDNTADVVRQYAGIRLITQGNAGPAAARNRGAFEAAGTILVFTDDDCAPTAGWLDTMLAPFDDPEVVGVKGVYRTTQKSLVARFVQTEYEDRYRLMERFHDIDFIDTYSAAFRRDRFIEMAGYDTSFPVACAEDIELSYRMSARGWKMKFIPEAVVYHTHPATFWAYLKKKYKFAFWRVQAVRKNPGKAVRDSHTPQTMKLQLMFLPALLSGLSWDLLFRPRLPASAMVLGAFLLSTLLFTTRAVAKDIVVGLLSPVMLAARACAQFAGVAVGLINVARKGVQVPLKYPAAS
jgi:cellulose synthase/poly-beta-1,6-N-acetylglucosamine synthase-like glycosyltransferase